jgi:GT2 family glycosyltransferase
VRVIQNPENLGFGIAVNQAIDATGAKYILTLNDDAYPAPGWIEKLIAACEADPTVGMCASQIRLQDGTLDSAGLEIYGDGTTKQRGHREAPAAYAESSDALLPSGCAALYRRRALADSGVFDPEYFLYGEDADLGLRVQLAGWHCR